MASGSPMSLSIRTQASISSTVIAATENPGRASRRLAGLGRSANKVANTAGSSVRLTAR